MTPTIRRGGPEDAAVIVEFNHRLASESEGITLEVETLTIGVRACLADPIKGEYYLALDEGGNPVGQLAVTREWSDWRNGWLWWIQSVYVRQEARRRGIFSALFRHVETLAIRDPEVIGLRLYMERDNHKARETYLRSGMETTPYVVFEKYPLDGNDARALQKAPRGL
jgi:GNAT superfamily N-acetyltransferase